MFTGGVGLAMDITGRRCKLVGTSDVLYDNSIDKVPRQVAGGLAHDAYARYLKAFTSKKLHEYVSQQKRLDALAPVIQQAFAASR